MAASSPARSPSISCCSSRGSSGPSCPAGPSTRDAPSHFYVGSGVRSLPFPRWSHALRGGAIDAPVPFVAATDGRRLATGTQQPPHRVVGAEVLLTKGGTST